MRLQAHEEGGGPEGGKGPPMTDDAARREWLALRKTGVGGTDVAAILGVSPWATAVDVWMDKTGRAAPRPDSVRFKIGRYFEAPIAQIYAEREGVTLGTVAAPGIVRHPTAPLLGSPDRLVAGRRKGLEIKTVDPSMAWQWGEDGSDEIPVYYAAQVATYMACCDYDEWDLAALFGMGDFRVYRLRRDAELERLIIDRVTEFWNRCVVGGEVPRPDGSDSYASYLAGAYPRQRNPLREATPGEAAALAELIQVRGALKECLATAAALENGLKSSIGSAEGIKADGIGKVSWRATKDRTAVDWEAVALDAMSGFDPEMARMLIAARTKTTPGPRVFRATGVKGDAAVLERPTADRDEEDSLTAVGRRKLNL